MDTTTLYAPAVSPEEYLEWERAAEYRSEHSYGEVVSMANTPVPHTLVATNIAFALRSRHRDGDCRAYPFEMRVQADPERCFCPDVTVVCGDRRFVNARQDMVTTSTLVVEVLSPSTEKDDRGRKAAALSEIPSLREYLFVEHRQPHVELYRRGADGGWGREVFERQEDELRLDSVVCTLPLTDLYEDINEN